MTGRYRLRLALLALAGVLASCAAPMVEPPSPPTPPVLPQPLPPPPAPPPPPVAMDQMKRGLMANEAARVGGAYAAAPTMRALPSVGYNPERESREQYTHADANPVKAVAAEPVSTLYLHSASFG
jgi:hypothetical protein